MYKQKIFFKSLSLIAIFLTISCKNSSDDSITKFTKLEASDTGIDFINTVSSTENFNVLKYRNFYNGGGVGVGDFNNDGLKDVFFTSNQGKNILYLNKGNLEFEDISESAGIGGNKTWSTGVAIADVNADGLLDIYVCNSGDVQGKEKENELFINLGNNKFKEAAAEYGLNDSGLSTHACFFDYDLDGDLDCYVLNNSFRDPSKMSLLKRERYEYDSEGGDKLYKNVNGKFINATEESKIFSSNIGFGLGISVGDINNDFYPDIYISNDFWERDYLYLNNKDGSFSEVLPDKISYTSVSSMGSDIADLNNDGHLDIFTTDMLPPENTRIKAATKFDDYYQEDLKYKYSYYHQFVQNCLQINRGDGTFQETSFYSGVAATDWSWGALMFDFNLDGFKDIFVSNGVYSDITDSDFVEFIADREKVKALVNEKGKFDFRDFEKLLPQNKRSNYAFINDGNGGFSNKSEQMGLDEPSFSNGSAYADLDNDGDFDLIVNNVNMVASVYKNNAVENKSNFVKIKLEGTAQNKSGIGAFAILYQNGSFQKYSVMASRGFQSSVDTDIIFGLNKSTVVDSIEIVWPDSKYQTIYKPKASTIITCNYSQALNKYDYKNKSEINFTEVSKNLFSQQIEHFENKYIDFDNDRLMPHMLSNESPKIISGDINGDKIEDFILTGAAGSETQVFINKNGLYIKTKQPDILKDTLADITAGTLVDLDNDGDLDLVLGKGGNEYRNKVNSFAVSTYLNNGKGDFVKFEIFNIKGQISCIKPCDYDQDGDIDLFFGGSAVPGAYGLTPRSFLMQNLGKNRWMDVTNEFLGPIGMVKDAIWSDINNDTWVDLIAVGEWMPVTFFVNKKGFFDAQIQLPASNGWWNCIKEADVDGDGDMDFILGNWGQNMKFKTSLEKPMKMYVGDFDENKRPDAIIEWFPPENDKPFPFASKMDLTSQLPFLKKTSLGYREYAKKQVDDLFPKELLSKATKKFVDNFNTSILYNDGGNYVLKPFIKEAQLSPVFSISFYDLDSDGINDIFLGGNYYKLKPEVGRHDAFNGGYYKGTGKGQYKFIPAYLSGITSSGEVRDSQIIDNKLFIARNNQRLLVYKHAISKKM